ncbi:MAG: PEP-CTERM sorting domain-containing protein [Pseudomonadota bacterium]
MIIDRLQRRSLLAFLAVAVLGSLAPLGSASAAFIEFSYAFESESDESGSQPSSLVLSGIVDGTVGSDGDTVTIDSFVSASLGAFDYSFSPATDIRTGAFGGIPALSFSGAVLDFWVCPGGFTPEEADVDCDFGSGGGGFLITNDFFGSGNAVARAGAPVFGQNFRAFDRPLSLSSWSARRVSVAEPGSLLLLLIGVAGGAAFARKRTTASLRD